MAWESQHVQPSSTEYAIGKFANRAMGNQFPNIQQDVVKTFNLYRFFVQHLNTPAAVLQPQITEQGVPMFTVADIQEIQTKIRGQQNTAYVKGIVQHGGTTAATAVTKSGHDESRNKFWDKMMRKFFYPVWSNIPPSWDGLLWYIFLLNSLEQMEIIGPFISTALDTITLTLPNIPSLIDAVLPKVLGLVPIPYASTAGDIISYCIGLVFVLLSVFINIQRKHFGSAFKASMEVIPVVGDWVSEMAQSMEIGVERYVQNRVKMLHTIMPVTPTLGNYLDYYAPDLDVSHEGPPPQLSIPAIKQEIAMYARQKSGFDGMMGKLDMLSNPKNLMTSVTQKTLGKASDAAEGAMTKAKNAATAKVTATVTKAANAATATVTRATNAASAAVTKATNAATASVTKAANAASAAVTKATNAATAATASVTKATNAVVAKATNAAAVTAKKGGQRTSRTRRRKQRTLTHK